MVVESLINPFKAEQNPKNMIFMGFLYCSLGVLLSIWIFKTYSSMILVFLTAMAAIPLVYNTIKMEEKKDMEDMSERMLIKEHGKALRVFIFLFSSCALLRSCPNGFSIKIRLHVPSFSLDKPLSCNPSIIGICSIGGTAKWKR